MDSDGKISLPSLLECGSEDGDVSYGWVAAQVDPNDALVPVFQGEGDDFEGGSEVIAAVDGEYEVRFHGGIMLVRTV